MHPHHRSSDVTRNTLRPLLPGQNVQKGQIMKPKKKKVLPSYMTSYKVNIRSVCVKNLTDPTADIVNPYVVFRLKGGEQYAKTSVEHEACNVIFEDTLQIDGQCVGSDMLRIEVYTASDVSQPNIETDKCIGVQAIPISSLELGIVKTYIIRLFRTIEGTTKKNRSLKAGAAGVINFEMQIADMGTGVMFQEKPWSVGTLYRLWVHVDSCKNVPLNEGRLPNVMLVLKIGPCLNQQRQRTPVIFQNDNPIWNMLQCFYVDDYMHQTLHVSLMILKDNGVANKVSSLKIPISLTRTPGNIFKTQMMFQSKNRGEKPCIFSYRLQILERGQIPFDGKISMKRQKLMLKMNISDIKDLPEKDTSKEVRCVVRVGDVEKRSKALPISENINFDQNLTFYHITHSEYLSVNVAVDNKVIGKAKLLLTKFQLNTKIEEQYYKIEGAESGEVKFGFELFPDDEDHIEGDDEDGDDDQTPIDVPESPAKRSNVSSHSLVRKLLQNARNARTLASNERLVQSRRSRSNTPVTESTIIPSSNTTITTSTSEDGTTTTTTTTTTSENGTVTTKNVVTRVVNGQELPQLPGKSNFILERIASYQNSSSNTQSQNANIENQDEEAKDSHKKRSQSIGSGIVSKAIHFYSQAQDENNESQDKNQASSKNINSTNKTVSSTTTTTTRIVKTSNGNIVNKTESTTTSHSSNASKSLKDDTSNASKSLTANSQLTQKNLSSDSKKVIKTSKVSERNISIKEDGDFCSFSWESNNSLFSSSFTGYSNCSRSLDTTVSESSERFHHYGHPDNDQNYTIKPSFYQQIRGTLVSASNLTKFGNMVYAIVQLRGKGHVKHFKFSSKELDEVENPKFNTELNFERVKKGDSIEVIIYQKRENNEKDLPIAYGTLECRSLKNDEFVSYNIMLQKPPITLYVGKELDNINNFGNVNFLLNSSVEYKNLTF